MPTPNLLLRQATVALALTLAAAVLALWVLGGSSVQGAATLTVTTTGDGGAGSLRQLLADAASGG